MNRPVALKSAAVEEAISNYLSEMALDLSKATSLLIADRTLPRTSETADSVRRLIALSRTLEVCISNGSGTRGRAHLDAANHCLLLLEALYVAPFAPTTWPAP